MKKTNSFHVLSTKLISDVFTSRMAELVEQQDFIIRVLTTCPGALEVLCQKRLGVKGLPPIPQGNPLSRHWQIENVIHYFGLKFSESGVLVRNGGGQIANWCPKTSKWNIVRSDF